MFHQVLYLFALPVLSAHAATDVNLTEDQLTRFDSDYDFGLHVSEQFDSNLYRLDGSDNEVDARVTLLKPRLSGKVHFGDFSTALELDYTAGKYSEQDKDDYSEYNTAISANWQPTTIHQFSLSSRLSSLHEFRGTGLTENRPFIIDSPLEYEERSHRLSYQLGSPRTSGRLQLSAQSNEKVYQNFPFLSDMRSYEDQFVLAEVFWHITGRTDLEFDVSQRETEYLNDVPELIGLPDSLNSTTSEALIGVRINPNAVSRGSILLGYRKRDFADEDREDFSGPGWQVNLEWSPKDHMTYSLETARESRETNGEGSFIDARYFTAGWKNDWSSRFATQITVEAEILDYQGSQNAREDSVFSGQLQITYKMRRWLNMGMSIQYQDSDSTVNQFDFQRNVAVVFFEISPN